MRFAHTMRAGLLLLLALLVMAGCSARGGATAKVEEPAKFKQFAEVVDYEFVAQYAKMPKPEGVMIIDSRPYKPKYVDGFIPTAVSIPWSQFQKKTEMLPADKNALLIFYCGGFECPLSHKSAFAAQAMGYTNVKVYAAGFPDWKAKAPYYSIGLEPLEVKMAKGESYMLIDARPVKKFLEGAIPSSVSIPKSAFDKKVGMLPADKTTPLIYYCGGFACPLSHQSAIMARALGYTNITVAEAGYPGWKKMFGGGAAVQVSGGKAEGSINPEQFLSILEAKPESILLIDVRSAEEYAAGHFPTAINISVDDLEAKAKTIPVDKPIVFSCASGARAGEAYYMFKDIRPEVKDVFYLEATNHFNSDNTFEVKPNE